MWQYSEDYLLSNNFNFEVPLEDLSPSNYLHPKILIMYNEALQTFIINNITLDSLLSCKCEDPEEKIKLKRNLLDFTHPKLEGTPQSYIWLIEHFLGLLPIPVLSSYVNGYCFKWLHLSQECTRIFQDRFYKRKTNNFNCCDRHIRNEIAKLPPQHQLLLKLHIEFVRKISFLNEKKRKRHIIYYSKYFTASLIVRPFRSGLNDNSEQKYYFLILYMALRWPSIKAIPGEHILRTIREMPESESSIVTILSCGQNRIQKGCKRLDKEYCNPSNSNNVDDTNEGISSSVSTIPQDKLMPKTEEAFSALSSSSEVVQNSDKHQLEEVNMEKAGPDAYNIIEKQQKEENNLNSIEITIKNEQTEKCSLNDTQYKQSTKEVKEDSSANNFHEHVVKSEQILGKKHQTLDETQNIEVHSLPNINKNPTKNVMIPLDHQYNPVTSCTNPEGITIDANVLKKISKIGWTYTPRDKVIRPPNAISLTKNISDDETTKQELIKSSQSEITLKKYPSVKSLRSRLSFLKIQRKKSGNNNLNTNLKYTKINT